MFSIHLYQLQWFGNMITPKWWNDLWLNEGFASYFEYKAQDVVNSSWNILKYILVADQQRAIAADTLQSAHPLVSNGLLTPNQITSIFDTITYSKGASILHMLENVIGKDQFQKCIKNYLKENQFKNVDTQIMLGYFKDAIKKV